jgi:hypothetical protein
MVLRGIRRSIGGAVLAVALIIAVAPSSEAAGGPCIRVGTHCYATVQDAVDAAHDGDTVRIPAGQFPGGVVVSKSIELVGAGAARSALVGGAQVLTIGWWQASIAPTVTVRGLTLRDGRSHSIPDFETGAIIDEIVAGGAGLLVLPSQTDGGPWVTIEDSVITRNISSPLETYLPTTPEEQSFWPHCPDGFCPFAGAIGGGVYNFGDLTLLRTTVSDNVAAGALTSDAIGGGIVSFGNLTVRSSTITGNRAQVVAPNGRYAEGGGIFMSGETTLTVQSSSVSGNVVKLSSTNPVVNPDGTTTEMLANSGGIHVNDNSTATIDSSHIDGNLAEVDNPQGAAGMINAGLQLTISDLTMTDSSVSRNRAVARVKTVGEFGPIGGALQWCNLATITGLRAKDNVTWVYAVDGYAASGAAVLAGATLCNGFDPGPSTLRDSVIANNRSTAISPHGRADVLGAGIDVASSLTMQQVRISGNTSLGLAKTGDVQGGGIWNGAFPLPFLEHLHSNLSLDRVVVTGNRAAGPQATGGGIYTRDPIAFSETTVRGNRPNDCTGCDAAPTAAAAAGGAELGAQWPRPSTDPLVARLVHR